MDIDLATINTCQSLLDNQYLYNLFFPVKKIKYIHNPHCAISSYCTKIKFQWFSVVPNGQNTLPYDIMSYKIDNWLATNIPRCDCGRDRKKIIIFIYSLGWPCLHRCITIRKGWFGTLEWIYLMGLYVIGLEEIFNFYKNY